MIKFSLREIVLLTAIIAMAMPYVRPYFNKPAEVLSVAPLFHSGWQEFHAAKVAEAETETAMWDYDPWVVVSEGQTASEYENTVFLQLIEQCVDGTATRKYMLSGLDADSRPVGETYKEAKLCFSVDYPADANPWAILELVAAALKRRVGAEGFSVISYA